MLVSSRNIAPHIRRESQPLSSLSACQIRRPDSKIGTCLAAGGSAHVGNTRSSSLEPCAADERLILPRAGRTGSALLRTQHVGASHGQRSATERSLRSAYSAQYHVRSSLSLWFPLQIVRAFSLLPGFLHPGVSWRNALINILPPAGSALL